jgi:lysophospholipase L1-like esterase
MFRPVNDRNHSPIPVHRIGHALAGVALAIGLVGCAVERVLPPAASDMVQAFGTRLDPSWRFEGAQVAATEVRLSVCRGGGANACVRVVLSDPAGFCDGRRAGPWCATFPDGPPVEPVLAALALETNDPWVAAPGSRHTGIQARWILPAGVALVLILVVGIALGVVRARRRRQDPAGCGCPVGAALRAPAVAVGLLVLSLAFLALTVEAGVRVWYWGSASRVQGIFDLYGVGGSTMAGEPYDPHVSPPLLVAARFDGRILGRDMRVHNLGQRGWSAYSQSVLLQRRVRHRDPTVPGAVLIYTGHNEGPLPDRPDAPSPLAAFLEQHSLAVRELLRLRPELRPPNTLGRFEWTLRRMVRTARDAGLTPILATAAANEATIEPNVRDDSVTSAVRRRLAAGEALEAAGRWTEAAATYLDGVPSDDVAWGLLAYRAARCLRRAGDTAGATELFGRVVATDPRTRFGRTTPAQNAVIRRVADEEGALLVDAEKRLRRAVPDRILDDRLFADGHHPNLAGYRVLAAGFAEALSETTGSPTMRALATDAEVCRVLACPPRDLPAPRLDAALWLLASSVRHPAPRDRLALARTHLEAALAQDPDDPRAWFTLAVTDAAQRGGLLWEDSDLQRILAAGINFGGRPCLPADARDEWLARFAEIGVAPGILDGLQRTSSPGFPRTCEPVLRDDVDAGTR